MKLRLAQWSAGRAQGRWGLVVTVAMVALVASSCARAPGRGSDEEITLPHHDSREIHLARAEGRLTVIETCLFLESSGLGDPLLIVWPKGVEARATDSGFDIVYQDVVRASEGDKVELAGAGPFRTPPDPDSFSPPIPDRCMEKAAAFWIGGYPERP